MTETCQCPPQAGSNSCELRPTARTTQVHCPANQQIGKPIDSLTIKALLAVPLTQLLPGEYYFCRAADCPTVYYTAGGSVQFTESDLRERVHQKHLTDEDVFVCYCFRHTGGSIRRELELTGTSTVIAAITTGIKAGQCACEIRNPQGSCCLGNVRAVVQQLEREIPKRSRGG